MSRRLLIAASGGGAFAAPAGPGSLVASGPYDPTRVVADTVLTQVHCHTNQSDGSYSPGTVVADYLAKGYGALIITDHDKITSQPAGIDIPIGGSEVSPTTGHVIAMNTTYTRGGSTDVQAILDGIAAAGGLAELAHPKWKTAHTYAAMTTLTGWSGMEIHNAKCVNGAGQNPVSYPGFAVDRWDQVLAGIRRDAWGYAVDDLHNLSAFNTLDTGRLHVFAESLDTAGIMAALASGDFVADVCNYGVTPGVPDRTDEGVDLSCTGATRIEAWGSSGLLASAAGSSLSYAFSGADAYVRLVAVGDATEAFGSALSDLWSAYSGSWAASGGTCNVGSNPSAAVILVYRRHREGDFTAQVDVNLGSAADASAGFLWNTLNQSYFYMAKIGPSTLSAWTNQLGVGISNGSIATSPFGAEPFTPAADTWYTLKMAYTSSSGTVQAKVWERGTTEPGWMVTASDTTWRNGMFGFRANRACSFDNLYVDGFRTYYQPISVDAA